MQKKSFKNLQKYILDEQHTNIDISKQVISEDYFAYNGLKFSKLDSKLTEADLKDLDKAVQDTLNGSIMKAYIRM